MSEPKRHHVQPQRYLRNFSDPSRDGWIWLLQLGSSSASQQQPHNVALEKHYNSIRRPDGSLDATMEKLLAEFEDSTYPAVLKVRDDPPVVDEDRHDLALFVNNMLNRSQVLRTRLEQQGIAMAEWTYQLVTADERWRRHCFVWLHHNRGTTEETFERDLKALVAGFDVEARDHRNIGLIPHANTKKRAEMIAEMSWTFVYAEPGQYFLTSDNPVVLLAPNREDAGASPVGLKHKDAVLTFPLTREVALVADWSGEDDCYGRTKRTVVKEINERIVRGARRFVYSPYASSSLRRLVGSLEPDEGPGFEMSNMPFGPGGISWFRMTIPRPNW